MDRRQDQIDIIRAALAPHGIFVRGIVHFEGDGPELGDEARASTVVLLGNIGGSIWPAFSRWRDGPGKAAADPLDTWSVDIIRPLANRLGGRAYFPSEKPWQPFQQWAMRAEGLKPSPLGVLIHPHYGLWHGYRGAIGLREKAGDTTAPFDRHPCDHCADRPCLTSCPADAVQATRFDVRACRAFLATPAGQAGCMVAGCVARNACPVGSDYRYPQPQAEFHMRALTIGAL